MSSRTLHYRISPFKVICPFTFIKHLLNYFVYGHPAIELFRNPLFMGILNKWETLANYLSELSLLNGRKVMT